VALVDEISDSITPLLDEAAAPADLAKATTAIFYSISNTQAGLRGVSFGDSLIKRVVETLKEEFPRLKTFATLSPIPGCAVDGQERAARVAGRAGRSARAAAQVAGAQELLSFAARYLGQASWKTASRCDPVARFHLGNGARVERLNWAADPSPKGLKQSFGLMVNYLYDLKRLDKHRTLLAQGQIPMSRAIEDLYG
jgi:malonyl-CoA decarboxylase